MLEYSALYLSCIFSYYVPSIKKECPEGLHGPNCQKSCSMNCGVRGKCDRVTGQCVGGCQAGWIHIQCDTSKYFSFVYWTFVRINTCKQ